MQTQFLNVTEIHCILSALHVGAMKCTGISLTSTTTLLLYLQYRGQHRLHTPARLVPVPIGSGLPE